MSQLSPAATLMWAILSVLCLKWNRTKEQGAFKRMLTYGYVLSVPLIVVFSVCLTILKYRYGYIQLLNGEIVPTPASMWSTQAQTMAKTLYVVFGVAWALEIVSHLEELNFWLYLLTTTAEPRPWLHSIYFYIWCFGSAAALGGLPVIAALSKDQDRAEANVFLIGSAGSTAVTLASITVNWLFPDFMRRIRKEGADAEVMCRLRKFNELNNIRVVFRFLLVGPTMVIGIKGHLAHGRVVPVHFYMELLAMLAGIGTIVSSAITLLVFFPRASLSEMVADQLTLQQQQETLTGGYYKHKRQGSSSSYSSLRYKRTLRRQDTGHYHKRSSSSSSVHTIDYPPMAFAKGNTLELELDEVVDLDLESNRSWTTTFRNGSNGSIPYSVTVERHDDTGVPLGLEDTDSERKRMSLGTATGVPYSEMHAKGMRYGETVVTAKSVR